MLKEPVDPWTYTQEECLNQLCNDIYLAYHAAREFKIEQSHVPIASAGHVGPTSQTNINKITKHGMIYMDVKSVLNWLLSVGGLPSIP